jgi:hypothetical protein
MTHHRRSMTYPANLLATLHRSYSAQDVKTTPVVERVFDHSYIAIFSTQKQDSANAGKPFPASG